MGAAEEGVRQWVLHGGRKLPVSSGPKLEAGVNQPTIATNLSY